MTQGCDAVSGPSMFSQREEHRISGRGICCVDQYGAHGYFCSQECRHVPSVTGIRVVRRVREQIVVECYEVWFPSQRHIGSDELMRGS